VDDTHPPGTGVALPEALRVLGHDGAGGPAVGQTGLLERTHLVDAGGDKQEAADADGSRPR
jgi:hypothetical protein